MKYLLLFLISGIYLSSYSQVLLADNKSANSNVTYLTTEAFKQKVFDFSKNKVWKYKGTKPAVIDFYTDWCRPCKMLAPLIESISNDYKGRIEVYKVNIDKEPQLADLFKIQSIPTILFISTTASQPEMHVGMMTKEELKNEIITFLKIK